MMQECYICEEFLEHDFSIYENIATEERICICPKCDVNERKHYFIKSARQKEEEAISLLGFTEKQSKIIITGLRDAHLSGGDGGGPYSDFDDEAFPRVLHCMHKIKEELK